MTLTCFRIHAFTQDPFGGNPACVIPLHAWPEDDWMLSMAREMGGAETAYIIPTPEGDGDLTAHEAGGGKPRKRKPV